MTTVGEQEPHLATESDATWIGHGQGYSRTGSIRQCSGADHGIATSTSLPTRLHQKTLLLVLIQHMVLTGAPKPTRSSSDRGTSQPGIYAASHSVVQSPVRGKSTDILAGQHTPLASVSSTGAVRAIYSIGAAPLRGCAVGYAAGNAPPPALPAPGAPYGAG